jgi:hypothetical protein
LTHERIIILFDLLRDLFPLWRTACGRSVMEKWRDVTIKFVDETIRPMRKSAEEVRKARLRFVWTFCACTLIWVAFVIVGGGV